MLIPKDLYTHCGCRSCRSRRVCRAMGVHISKVLSVQLDDWTKEQVIATHLGLRQYPPIKTSCARSTQRNNRFGLNSNRLLTSLSTARHLLSVNNWNTVLHGRQRPFGGSHGNHYSCKPVVTVSFNPAICPDAKMLKLVLLLTRGFPVILMPFLPWGRIDPPESLGASAPVDDRTIILSRVLLTLEFAMT